MAHRKKSGTSRTYQERKTAGRPNVTISMSVHTRQLLYALASRLGISMSKVVDIAIRELADRSVDETR